MIHNHFKYCVSKIKVQSNAFMLIDFKHSSHICKKNHNLCRRSNIYIRTVFRFVSGIFSFRADKELFMVKYCW